MNFTPPLQLNEQTLEALHSSGHILVGVSGGRDSIALITLLSKLANCYPIVCHVNHSLRPEADAEEIFVKNYAHHLGLPFVSKKIDVTTYAKEHKLATEEAARILRQDLFFHWAREFNTNIVALAHHRNDQAETALLHLCRGSSGIRAMTPVSLWANGLTVIRPLLNQSRSDITAWLSSQNIPWVDDTSNDSSDYTRNALRHQILPQLDSIFARDVSITLSRSANLAHVSRTALTQALEHLNLLDPQGRLYLPTVMTFPAELRQAAIHWFLKNQNIPELSEEVVQRVLDILPPTGASRVSLPGGYLAIRKEKRLFVKKLL
ncbi:MAG: tRNA lysidine(34) synthetase TilS [Akkermansia sp.]|nr:tRNA lysidine(34) synthetase TilS [Akkermansia sp.]